MFTRWGVDAGRLSVEARTLSDATFLATSPTVERHPVVRPVRVTCTAQLARPGRWLNRHGCLQEPDENTPSEGLPPHARAREAIATRAEAITGAVQVRESRTATAVKLWMSMAYACDVLSIRRARSGDFEPALRLRRGTPFGACRASASVQGVSGRTGGKVRWHGGIRGIHRAARPARRPA